MRDRIAVIYNQPTPGRYGLAGEEAAVTGVLEAVAAVCSALQALGYDVTRLPLTPPIEHAGEQLRKLNADLVFNLFEGFGGYPQTEADIADALSALGLSFTGSPGAALRLALDKARATTSLKRGGIATPGFQLLDSDSIGAFSLRFPCIVKPAAEDASHGISERSVVYNPAELKEQVAHINDTYSNQALVEEYIDGREFNITILGNRRRLALPVSEIIYSLPPGKPHILTFDAKWRPDSPYFSGTRVGCPADIDDGQRRRIERTASAACGLLGCRGYARVDMRIDEYSRPYVIEVNPNPDISPGAGVARQAQAAGLGYTQLIDRIVQLALENERSEAEYTADAAGR